MMLFLILLVATAAPLVVLSSGEPTRSETALDRDSEESQSALDRCCVIGGDVDGSGWRDIADMSYLLGYLWFDGSAPPCLGEAANIDDYELTTIRDLLVLIESLFGGAIPDCDVPNPPFHGPVHPDNYIEVIEDIFPGGDTTITVHLKIGHGVSLTAVNIPLKVRVDGQIPTISNLETSPDMSGLDIQNLKIDPVNGKVLISLYQFSGAGIPPDTNDMAQFNLTMPYDALDRLISVTLDTMPPIEDGRAIHYPVLIEPDFSGWTPYILGAPAPQAIVALSPGGIFYPSSGPPSVQVDTTLAIVNLGSATLNYSIQDTIISGPPSLWLTYDGFDGSVEPGVGNFETGNLHLNTGGAIDSQMVADSGGVVQLSAMLILSSNAPSSPDTFIINFHVIDESLEHEQDEMGDSTQTTLSVSSDGNYGAMGSGGNMAFPDDPDTTASVYLFDGSPVIGWIDGRGDTIVSLSSYGSSWQPGVGFRPADTATSYHYSSYLYDVYSTGLFTDWDSSVWVEQLWYSPRSFAPGVDNFYIQKLRLFVADGQPKQNMVVGQAIDWNIPSDFDEDNGSGFDLARDMIYQFGLADPGKSSGNDLRFGGVAFLGSYLNGQIYQSNPFGMYTADNASNIDPIDGYDSKQLYQNMGTTSGASVFSGPDQDLHMAMTAVQGLTLQPYDTLEIYSVFSTSREGLPELQDQVENSQIFFDRRVDGQPESAHGIGGTFLANIDGVYGIHARILGDRTGGTVFHYEVSDTTGNGDFAEVGPWGTANVYLDGENNTHVVVTDPVALANGAYLFFAYQPGDSLSRTPLLNLYWEDIAQQWLEDIPIPTFSAIDVGSPPGAKASGDTVVVRKQTLWGCTVNFTFYAADTLISFADLTGDIRRHSPRIQLVSPHPTMQLLGWWKPPFQQGYRALYEGLLETQSILRKIVYLRTDLSCGGSISLQEFNVFDPDRPCCFGLRGNINGEIDNQIDVADLTFLVDFLFRGGFAPPCFDEADFNGSGGVDVSDLTDMVDYLFGGGDTPAFCP